ncbi:substrate-binding and GGDEF domain-containing protein [Actinoplanes flavus]|uniref:GGDEF domain-containing protein n=1 Tax=Actinoplanes flavus TaxID=2820290 RepID=A0ABS3UKU9_9ACTN|nr:GGDEF domain-containing protein [Actinoplanes flavus]MBO3738826.1 GGDEF domain-containing protein [Actinoplanes flavus]
MSGRVFGILSPFVGGDYYGAIIEGANAAAVAAGDRVMAMQTLNPGSHSADRSGLPDFDRPLAWRHLSGLAVLPGAVATGYATDARQAGLPVVFVAQEAPASSVVLADNRSGVRDAVAHLIEHGHERIAFAGYLAHFDLRERHAGYAEALTANGLEPLVMDTGDNHESGGEAVADLLIRAGMPVSAIVLGTDRNAIGLIGRMRAAGYAVPGDIAVVGFDDIADAAYLRPALSSVRQPLDELGRALYELMDHPVPRREVPTVFVNRESCGCTNDGLPVSEAHTRALFGQVSYLQETLNIQYELGVALLGTQERDPRDLAWLELTPATAGCLGLWQPDLADTLHVRGGFRFPAGGLLPVDEFPPADLFERAYGADGEIVFVVPIRTPAQDWGLLAAVGRIQSTTPPGREMMNHSGSLLAKALDYGVMQEKLRQAALRDHLTGLPNRVLLEDRMAQAERRAAREAGYRFAILLLDLDGFKAVNDTHGHAAGDQLLIQVARRLTKRLRRTDTVARLGGDEFVVLIDGVSGSGGTHEVIAAIKATVTEPFTIDGHVVEVGLSIGAAISGDGTSDPDYLLREADAAMYRAKSVARQR